MKPPTAPGEGRSACHSRRTFHSFSLRERVRGPQALRTCSRSPGATVSAQGAALHLLPPHRGRGCSHADLDVLNASPGVYAHNHPECSPPLFTAPPAGKRGTRTMHAARCLSSSACQQRPISLLGRHGNERQHCFCADWSMGAHMCFCTVMHVVRVCRDFGMMRCIVPALPQLPCRILPMKSILEHPFTAFHDLKTLKHLKQVTAMQCEPIAEQSLSPLRFFADDSQTRHVGMRHDTSFDRGQILGSILHNADSTRRIFSRSAWWSS